MTKTYTFNQRVDIQQELLTVVHGKMRRACEGQKGDPALFAYEFDKAFEAVEEARTLKIESKSLARMILAAIDEKIDLLDNLAANIESRGLLNGTAAPAPAAAIAEAVVTEEAEVDALAADMLRMYGSFFKALGAESAEDCVALELNDNHGFSEDEAEAAAERVAIAYESNAIPVLK